MENNELMSNISLEETSAAEQTLHDHLNHYYHDPQEINARLMELEKEPDIDTWLHTESAALTIVGTVLGLISSKRWLALPLAASIVIIGNVLRKNKKPMTYLRYTGLRRREEIEKEKYALKALRGDFKYLLDVPNAVLTAVNK